MANLTVYSMYGQCNTVLLNQGVTISLIECGDGAIIRSFRCFDDREHHCNSDAHFFRVYRESLMSFLIRFFPLLLRLCT